MIRLILGIVALFAVACATPPFKIPGTIGKRLEQEFERQEQHCMLPHDGSATSIPLSVRIDYGEEKLNSQKVQPVNEASLQALFLYAYSKPDAAEAGRETDRMIGFFDLPRQAYESTHRSFDALLYRANCAQTVKARLDAKAKLSSDILSSAIEADANASSNSNFVLLGGKFQSPLHLGWKSDKPAVRLQTGLTLWNKYASKVDLYDPIAGPRPLYLVKIDGYATGRVTTAATELKTSAYATISGNSPVVSASLSSQARAQSDSMLQITTQSVLLAQDSGYKPEFETLPSAEEIKTEFLRAPLPGAAVLKYAFASAVLPARYRFATAGVPAKYCEGNGNWSVVKQDESVDVAQLGLREVTVEGEECAFYVDILPTAAAMAAEKRTVTAAFLIQYNRPLRQSTLAFKAKENVSTTEEPQVSPSETAFSIYNVKSLAPIARLDYGINLVVRDAKAKISRTETEHDLSGVEITCSDDPRKYAMIEPRLRVPEGSAGGILRLTGEIFLKSGEQPGEPVRLCTLGGKALLEMEVPPGMSPQREERKLSLWVYFPTLKVAAAQ